PGSHARNPPPPSPCFRPTLRAQRITMPACAPGSADSAKSVRRCLVRLTLGPAVLLGSLGLALGAGPPKPTPASRTDLYGDPLPDGAVVRFGSVRFRHAELSVYVCLPGGKTVLTAGSDRVLRFWDLASG